MTAHSSLQLVGTLCCKPFCHTNTACTAPVLDAVELALASLPLTSLYASFSFPSATYLWFLQINKYIK